MPKNEHDSENSEYENDLSTSSSSDSEDEPDRWDDILSEGLREDEFVKSFANLAEPELSRFVKKSNDSEIQRLSKALLVRDTQSFSAFLEKTKGFHFIRMAFDNIANFHHTINDGNNSENFNSKDYKDSKDKSVRKILLEILEHIKNETKEQMEESEKENKQEESIEISGKKYSKSRVRKVLNDLEELKNRFELWDYAANITKKPETRRLSVMLGVPLKCFGDHLKNKEKLRKELEYLYELDTDELDETNFVKLKEKVKKARKNIKELKGFDLSYEGIRGRKDLRDHVLNCIKEDNLEEMLQEAKNRDKHFFDNFVNKSLSNDEQGYLLHALIKKSANSSRREECISAIKILINEGADVSVKNIVGQTPLNFAKSSLSGKLKKSNKLKGLITFLTEKEEGIDTNSSDSELESDSESEETKEPAANKLQQQEDGDLALARRLQQEAKDHRLALELSQQGRPLPAFHNQDHAHPQPAARKRKESKQEDVDLALARKLQQKEIERVIHKKLETEPIFGEKKKTFPQAVNEFIEKYYKRQQKLHTKNFSESRCKQDLTAIFKSLGNGAYGTNDSNIQTLLNEFYRNCINAAPKIANSLTVYAVMQKKSLNLLEENRSRNRRFRGNDEQKGVQRGKSDKDRLKNLLKADARRYFQFKYKTALNTYQDKFSLEIFREDLNNKSLLLQALNSDSTQNKYKDLRKALDEYGKDKTPTLEVFLNLATDELDKKIVEQQKQHPQQQENKQQRIYQYKILNTPEICKKAYKKIMSSLGIGNGKNFRNKVKEFVKIEYDWARNKYPEGFEKDAFKTGFKDRLLSGLYFTNRPNILEGLLGEVKNMGLDKELKVKEAQHELLATELCHFLLFNFDKKITKYINMAEKQYTPQQQLANAHAVPAAARPRTFDPVRGMRTG